MSVLYQKSGSTATLRIEGDLTLNGAAELRAALIKAIIDADEVVVEFGAVNGVDLSCLQLFCSAHRSAGRMNKRFRLSGNHPELFTLAVEDAGYRRITGCSYDRDNSCLWTVH